MAEVTQEAYQDLRDYIQSNWQYIELQDDTDTPIVRLDTSDSRVSWIHNDGDQTLKLQAVIKGSDSDISLPTIIAKSVLFNVETGGNALSSEAFEAFTIEQDEDELTVVHNIQSPKVV